MDFIYALLDALMPSRVAKAEVESLREGLMRLETRQVPPTTLEQFRASHEG
jgi:hypothetical protein